MAYVNPSISDFKSFFQRDFPYTNDASTLTGANDTDLTNALQLGFINMPGFAPDQQTYTIWNLYLSAHYLVLALRQGTQGITGNWPWLESSKGVGGASQGLSIPERVLSNPKWSVWSKTYYGLIFLDQVMPYLNGAAMVLPSRTNP